MLRGEQVDAERMIMNLSAFLRSSLTVEPAEDISLADELDLQRRYLDIEQVRFPDRLAVAMDVPPELAGALVPGQIVQPLIENAIKYGVAPATGRIAIRISASAQDGELHIVVRNDVQPGVRLPGGGTGLGLNNVRERLVMRHGARGGCEWGPDDAGGFVVRLWMPLMCGAGEL